MPLNIFYTMVQKSQKWPKTQIKGSCLNVFLFSNRKFVSVRTIPSNQTLSFSFLFLFFALWDPIFAVFSVKVNKGGYSSHLLQSRILKNVLEPDLPPI